MNYVLFREKPTLMLCYLLQDYTDNPKTLTYLSFKIKSHFSYVQGIIGKCIKNELVAAEKKGRIVELSLTKKGYIIAQNLKIVWDKLEKIEKDNLLEVTKNGTI